MKPTYQRLNACLLRAMVASVISSLPLMAACLAGKNAVVDVIIKILIPALFWIGLGGEIFFLRQADKIRKALETEEDPNPIGLIAVFKTKEGKIADITFAAAVVLYGVLALAKWGTGFLQYFVICVAVLAFRLHCILNGKIFRFCKSMKKRKGDEDV